MVSTKLILSWISATEKSAEFKEASLSISEIQSKLASQEDEYVSWNSFLQWIVKLRKLKLTQAQWEEIGEKSLSLSHFDYIKDLSKMVGGIELTYWTVIHWVLPVQVPMIRVESYKQNKDGSIEFELCFHPEAEPLNEVFYASAGALRFLPQVCFGESNSNIEMLIQSRSAKIKIITNQKHTLIDRVKKTISNIIPMKALTKEFNNLQKQTLAYYSNSIEKEKRLKIMDQMLSATSKLSTLGEATASIIHDINNPLATAHLLIESVSVNLEKNDLEQAKLQIEKVKRALSRITKTVKTIQGFLHQQKKEVYTEVTLLSIVDESIAMVDQKLKKSNATLQIDIEAKLKITCDSSQLIHLMVNQLSNALDAIEALPEKWIRIETKDSGDVITIRVIDSGLGIPEEIRERILEPFFTTKDKYKGTGLGLSINKRIAESFGGKLYVDATNSNTCFVIELPKQPVLQQG
ncbi:MAG: GHKL domain-containing protein [Xanthomonadaceae bacterium]|nr:GHKL domain-containing protein [Xanthomonadaceae bacterium]